MKNFLLLILGLVFFTSVLSQTARTECSYDQFSKKLICKHYEANDSEPKISFYTLTPEQQRYVAENLEKRLKQIDSIPRRAVDPNSECAKLAKSMGVSADEICNL